MSYGPATPLWIRRGHPGGVRFDPRRRGLLSPQRSTSSRDLPRGDHLGDVVLGPITDCGQDVDDLPEQDHFPDTSIRAERQVVPPC